MISDVLQLRRDAPGQLAAQHLDRGISALIAARGFQADAAQQSAIKLLAEWIDAWQRGRRGWPRAPKAGVYLWGGVGRGKSLVMDAFFTAAPVKAKRRVHFHGFLQEVLERLQQITGQPDPLARVAREISVNTRLLCFDEFHVHDIGDAVLLGRLLKHLVGEGIGIVATSNYMPQALCPNPLYRDRFKPAIELIERRFASYNLDGGEDYRQRANGGYVWGAFVQVAENAQNDWVTRRLQLPASAEQDVQVAVNHRPLHFCARYQATAWLHFDALCRLPRSSADFLWLSRTFECLAITGVPPLDGQGIDVQQRFLNLIDILYDSGIELNLVAEVGLPELLSAGAHVDFARTRSRLQQLRKLQSGLQSGEPV